MDGLFTEYPENRISDAKLKERDILLKPSEAAKLLNIHINTVRRWSNLGILPSFRIGPRNDRRFLKRDVMSFLFEYTKVELGDRKD
jgi:excisionase family DNA binding protein